MTVLGGFMLRKVDGTQVLLIPKRNMMICKASYRNCNLIEEEEEGKSIKMGSWKFTSYHASGGWIE